VPVSGCSVGCGGRLMVHGGAPHRCVARGRLIEAGGQLGKGVAVEAPMTGRSLDVSFGLIDDFLCRQLLRDLASSVQHRDALGWCRWVEAGVFIGAEWRSGDDRARNRAATASRA
jgi:hypothetical protein